LDDAVTVDVGANAVFPDSFRADLFMADTVLGIAFWIAENSSGHQGKDNAEDRVVDDKVRQPTQDLEVQVRSNAGRQRRDRAPYKGWREYIATSGCLYYHHKVTNTAQWKKTS